MPINADLLHNFDWTKDLGKDRKMGNRKKEVEERFDPNAQKVLTPLDGRKTMLIKAIYTA